MSQYFFFVGWITSKFPFKPTKQTKKFCNEAKNVKDWIFRGGGNINYKRKEGWKKAALKLLMMSK